MKRTLLSLFVLCFVFTNTQAQDGYIQQGEFGFSIGGAHYFGDLNTRSGLNRPKPALGLFFRKQFGNYVGLRVAGRFAQLGYDDLLSKNDYQYTRGLEFNSNIFEFGLQGDFNFFRFIPGDPLYPFTPYITLGVGTFNYDPYAFLNGQKYFLRKLGTEGQGTAAYPDRKPYSNQAFCFPLGMGVKYNLSKNIDK